MLRLLWLVFQQPVVRKFTINWYVYGVQTNALFLLCLCNIKGVIQHMFSVSLVLVVYDISTR